MTISGNTGNNFTKLYSVGTRINASYFVVKRSKTTLFYILYTGGKNVQPLYSLITKVTS